MKYETERLILKPTDEADSRFILQLLNSPKWLRFIGDRNVHTDLDAKDYIRVKILPQFHRLGYSNFTLITKDNNAKVGSCGLYDREGLAGVDLGYALLPEYEGLGYALESAKRILELAQTEWSITEVSAITSQENLASQALLLKLGFAFNQNITLNGEMLKLFKKELSEKTSV